MAGCVCVSYLGSTWHQDALWEEGEPAEAVSCFGQCSARETLGSAVHVDVTLTCSTYLSIVADHFKVLTWPPNSPDLNPMQHLWDVLDKQVRSMETPPRNLQDLKDLLLTSWCQIPQQTFRDLVESRPRRVRAVLAAKVEQHNIRQVVIIEGNKWKTTFHTTRGHDEYLVTQFGLTNAPAMFQAFVKEIFKDLIDRYLIVYIDDILIYSPSYNKHVHHIRIVLARLCQNQLYVKVEKCEFYKDFITFLGYIISWQGVEMDPKKVTAAMDWPEPTTIKELQRFLGFANFYRWLIHNYSSIASPLTSLL
ncbi:hypothetical protein QTP86_021422 [Hemibagrus guttatus]|nr:hypothetical protein QTP86_021422 [Hemibagrus guttatus]